MMMNRTLLTLTLLALPVAADDAATRYHEAYVREVIEGKIAGAAKDYLALAENADTPARIRNQAAFRFAVCVALLGRPDEARARLAALRTRDGVGTELRAQIQEYLRTLENVAPGSALQKRLDDLTFELGRSAHTTPKVYRDFEILGKKALPHLRQLLTHKDLMVRQHAFRLLLRLNEPEMARHWRPEYHFSAGDLREYLKRNDDQRAAIEPRLIEFPWRLSELAYGPKWSVDFIVRLAATGDDAVTSEAVSMAANRYREPDVLAVLDRWLSDDKLKQATAHAVLRTLKWAKHPDALMKTARFARVVEALKDEPLTDTNQTYGLIVFTAATSVDVVLAQFEQWVQRSTERPFATKHPMLGKFGETLASVIDKAELNRDQRMRYRANLIAWLNWMAANTPTGTKAKFGRHLRVALEGSDDIRLMLKSLVEGPLAGNRIVWLAGFYDMNEPGDQRFFETALLAASGQARAALLSDLSKVLSKGRPPIEVKRQIAARGPEWIVPLGKTASPVLTQALANVAIELPVTEAQALLRRCVAKALEIDSADQTYVLGAWYSPMVKYRSGHATPHEFQARVALPLADEVARQLPPASRRWFVDTLAAQIRLNTELKGELRRQVARIVLRHVGEIRTRSSNLSILSDAELFPPEDWLHHWHRHAGPHPSQEAIRAAAARLVENPAKAHPRITANLASLLGKTQGREFVDALLTKGDANVIARIASTVTAENVSGPAAEKALDTLLASDPVDLDALGHIAGVLADIRASDKLVPVAQRLLRATEADHVDLGIHLARSLARRSLRKDLVALLESPDANIRNHAKRALEEMQKWEQFKAGVKLLGEK